MRMLRTHNTYFEWFTQQISSESSEQSQARVKSSVEGRMRKSRLRKDSWQKETNSYWKMWNRKKWILWCKLQGVIMQHLETDCENVLNLPKKSKMRHSGKESLLGCADHSRRRWWFWRSKSSLQRVYTPPSCWSRFQSLCRNSRTIYKTSSSKFILYNPDRKSWVVTCRRKNRVVEELHLRDPGHNPTCSELLFERSIAKQSEPGWTEMEQSRIEETHATQSKLPTNPVYQWKKRCYLFEKRSGTIFLPVNLSKETLFKSKSQNWSWDWYDIITKMKEKLTTLLIGTRWAQNCGKHCTSQEDENYRIRIGSNTSMKDVTKWGSSVAWNSSISYCIFRVIQGHNGWNMKAPELMGHVATPFEWKEFLFHRGCSFNVTSILKTRLIAGGRESKQGRQAIFFTPLNPFGDNPDEEQPSDDHLSKPRKFSTTVSGNLVRTPSTGSI